MTRGCWGWMPLMVILYHGVFVIGLHINRRPLTVVELACASRILFLREISFFSQLSSSPLFTCAASRDLDIGLTRPEKQPF